MIRTILVDDHRLFSDGLKKLLEDSAQFMVLNQFKQGDLLLETIAELKPDLIITDLEILGQMDGIEVIRRIRINNKTMRVVVLTMHEESIYSREAHAAGADAYLTKSIESSLLIEQLLKVVNGEKIFSATRSVIEESEHSILSKQERRILRLIAEGKTSEEIASALGISGLTVKVHRRNIMKKMNVESAAMLIATCFSKGIL